MKFKVGDKVHIKVFSTYLGTGVIVSPSTTNMGQNWMIRIKDFTELQDISSCWLKKLTKLELVLT